MKNKEKNRLIIVGAFVFIGLVIMIAAIFMLGGKESKFAKHVTVIAVFDNIEGLKPGNNIWLSGMKIGTVKHLQFVESNKIKLTLKIEEEFGHLVRQDSRAKIGSDGLIGNKIVVIEGGSPSAPAVRNNDVIQTTSYNDMAVIMHLLQENGQNLTAITQNLKSLTDDIVAENGLVGALIKDKQLTKDVKNFLGSSQNAIANVNVAARNLNTFSGQFNNRKNSLNKILNDTTIYTDLHYTIENIKIVSENLNNSSEEIANVTEKLNTGDNTIRLLFNDKQTANDVKVTLENLKTSSEKLEENLDAMRYSFPFRKGIKKMEKEKKKQVEHSEQ